MNEAFDAPIYRWSWTPGFLLFAVIASILATAVATARVIAVNYTSLVFPLLAGILAALAWNRALGSYGPDTGKTFAGRTQRRLGSSVWILLAASMAFGVTGLLLHSGGPGSWFLLIATYVLLVMYLTVWFRATYGIVIVAPLLFGLMMLDTGALLGSLSPAGFPAAFAVLLALISHATHDLERRVRMAGIPEGEDPHIHISHRRSLSWIAIAFFLFGVVCFWPWLGHIYGSTYLWLMVVGVLAPLLYLWGRLRQPRRQNSYSALRRFNHLVPYLAIVLLVAIALG